MIKERNFFVYFHRRPDTGEIFYVGKGRRYGRARPTRRAEETRGRSKAWQSIVSRNGGKYSIEIAEWLDTPEEASDLERFHIAMIGRRKNGGPLINQTDGGDGTCGHRHTTETRERLRAAWARNPDRANFLQSEEFQRRRLAGIAASGGSMRGKRHSDATKAVYSRQRSGAKNPQAKRLVDTSTGVEYGCVAEAAAAIGLARGTLYNYLRPNGSRTNTTTLRYL